MATPEYLLTSGDHERLLILVKQVSSDQQLSAPAFDRIFDRITRMTEVRMPDGRGRVRVIKLRYKKTEYDEEYSEEYSEDCNACPAGHGGDQSESRVDGQDVCQYPP